MGRQGISEGFFLTAALVVVACGGRARDDLSFGEVSFSDEELAESSALPLTSEQLQSTWRALAVPSLGNAPQIAQAPDGFLALSNGNDGDESTVGLYHSRDGISWTRQSLGPDQNQQSLSDLACSPERCVVAGRDGSSMVSYASDTGTEWQRSSLEWTGSVQRLRYGGGYFFVVSQFTGSILRSADGLEWQEVLAPPSSSAFRAIHDLAYGDGLFVAGGSSSTAPALVYRSRDGESWDRFDPVETCVEPTNGRVLCNFLRMAFADGQFWGHGARSTDGLEWTPTPTQFPDGVAGNSILHFGGEDRLLAADRNANLIDVERTSYNQLPQHSESSEDTTILWGHSWAPLSASEDYQYPPGSSPPSTLEFPWPDGLTCRQRRCVIRETELYLIP